MASKNKVDTNYAVRPLRVKGGYYYYGNQWYNETHSITAAGLRSYGKTVLGLADSPQTLELWASAPKGRTLEKLPMLKVPKSKGDKCVCQEWRGNWDSNASEFSHEVPPDVAYEFCTNKLFMVPADNKIILKETIKEVVKEVVKIVDKIVEVEVIRELPVNFSFEQREILANALMREQHILNKRIHQEMLSNNPHGVSVVRGRLDALLEGMRMIGITPDDWSNTPVWLMETNRLLSDNPSEVLFEGLE